MCVWAWCTVLVHTDTHMSKECRLESKEMQIIIMSIKCLISWTGVILSVRWIAGSCQYCKVDAWCSKGKPWCCILGATLRGTWSVCIVLVVYITQGLNCLCKQPELNRVYSPSWNKRNGPASLVLFCFTSFPNQYVFDLCIVEARYLSGYEGELLLFFWLLKLFI